MVCLPRACPGRTAGRFPANSFHMRCVELALEGLASAGKCLLYTGFPDAGKGSAVCSSLYCGTRYLTAVLARPTAQLPRWAWNVSGEPGSIPGRFWCTGVPSFRRCSGEPLHSGSVKYRDVVRPLHRPLRYRVRGWGCLKNKFKKNTGFPQSVMDGYAILMSPRKGKTAVHGCHCLRDMAVRMREVMARR